MLIGRKFKIESEDLNITLFKKNTSKKTGKDYWVAIGYFSTVKSALKEFADMGLRESKLKDLISVAKKQDEIYRLIKNLKFG